MEDRLEHAMKACKLMSEERAFLDKKIPEKTIYIMKCNKYYKIGYTHDIYERFCNYKVHNPYQVKLLRNSQEKTPRFKEYEQWIHDNYSDKLHRGEWYCFDKEDIKAITNRWFIAIDM